MVRNVTFINSTLFDFINAEKVDLEFLEFTNTTIDNINDTPIISISNTQNYNFKDSLIQYNYNQNQNKD